MLHLVWGRMIGEGNSYILAAASRTNDVHFYSYSPSKDVLSLEKTIQVAENIFCLYIDLLTYQTYYHLLVSSNESTVISIHLDQ